MTTVKKAAAKKATVPKTSPASSDAKKTSSKKSSAKKTTGRKYSPAAAEDVREEMDAMKHGQLHIGRSSEKVTNPKQAIAIGLAKARREGKEVPPNPNTGR